MNLQQTKQKIIDFIKTEIGKKPAIIGLSGGLDSSTLAFLTVEALGKDKIFGFTLPSSTNTEKENIQAKQVAELLNIKYQTINIDNIVKAFQKQADFFENKKNIGNLKARIRMSILYGQANEAGGVVLGTGNKTELSVGYFTKYGDGGVDLLPLGDLYKTEVRELAKYMGIPKEIIDQPPTAGLWEDQTDEGELGITYENLDKILKAIEGDKNLSGFDQSEIEIVQDYISKSEHKRIVPLICKVTKD